MARPSRWAEVSAKRGPSPPLLRPQRRWSVRTVSLALVLCLAAVLGGIVVGLGLRPPPTPDPEPQVAVAPAPPPVLLPAPDAAAPDARSLEAQLAALRRAAEQEQARLDGLTRARIAAEAEQQARLDGLARARAAAEAQLAALQRDLATAQREREATLREASPALRREVAPLPPVAAPPPAISRPGPAPGGQPRVFVHHRAGSPVGAEAAAALVASLRDGGFEVPDIRPVAAVPSQRVVRYFYAEDAAAAARLAGRLGRGWAIQDFRGYEPSPGPGTLEVWVPDR
ncbi:hypothetical protein ACFQS7_09665 [Dankookia sp. GCM10030260]|uniref:hypothetical protein n=1 Tax=Dankookia sp. GCM10030260 TaxID=3273390 RepID=UPI0036166333